MVKKRTPPTTEFGKAMTAMLDARAAALPEVSASMGLSPSYAYNVMRGTKTASPGFVTAFSTALSVSPEEKQRLNVAAARDAGFTLDLPEDW